MTILGFLELRGVERLVELVDVVHEPDALANSFEVGFDLIPPDDLAAVVLGGMRPLR